jgi:transcriptional regulator
MKHLHELTDSQEIGSPEPWSVADAPLEYVERLAKAIVGVEISVDRLEGTWKVSQNRSDADRQGVIAGLEALGSHSSQEMANLVRDRRSAR